MAKGQRKFADDGWAFWIDGEDASNIYLNDWLNPKGKSYVDVAIQIHGVKASKSLHVYVPFSISKAEIEDVSLSFQDKKFLQATFSAACIVDYMKNQHASEIAYNGKTVDIVHISTLDYKLSSLSEIQMNKVSICKYTLNGAITDYCSVDSAVELLKSVIRGFYQKTLPEGHYKTQGDFVDKSTLWILGKLDDHIIERDLHSDLYKKGALDSEAYGGTFAGSGVGIEFDHLSQILNDWYNHGGRD